MRGVVLDLTMTTLKSVSVGFCFIMTFLYSKIHQGHLIIVLMLLFNKHQTCCCLKCPCQHSQIDIKQSAGHGRAVDI